MSAIRDCQRCGGQAFPAGRGDHYQCVHCGHDPSTAARAEKQAVGTAMMITHAQYRQIIVNSVTRSPQPVTITQIWESVPAGCRPARPHYMWRVLSDLVDKGKLSVSKNGALNMYGPPAPTAADTTLPTKSRSI